MIPWRRVKARATASEEEEVYLVVRGDDAGRELGVDKRHPCERCDNNEAGWLGGVLLRLRELGDAVL